MKTKSILLSLLLISTAAFAQRSGERTGPAHISNFNLWTVGAQAGFTYTMADLTSFEDPEKSGLKIGMALSAHRHINYTLGFKMEAIFGFTGGSNSSIQKFYNGNYQGGSGMLTFNLSNMFVNGAIKDRTWTWGLGVGGGLTSFGSVVENYDGSSAKQVPFNNLIPSIPVEIEAKKRINENLSLTLQFDSRIIFTDDLDGVAYIEGNMEAITFFNAGVTYDLGKKAQSAEWTNPLDDMYFEVQDMAATIDGMSNDADGDGVADLLDEDDYTPEGVAVDGSGNALDVDMDGVPDHLDADPFTVRGATVDENGRELDSDGDGVADSRDQEANTTKGALVNFQGKEIAASGGVAASLPSVFFGFNSTSVNYANYERLATLARAMKSNPSLKLNVIGNTDETGGEDANMKIGEKRAQAVVDHLVKIYGIDASRFTASSKGESDLLANGVHRINRRVDFEVAK